MKPINNFVVVEVLPMPKTSQFLITEEKSNMAKVVACQDKHSVVVNDVIMFDNRCGIEEDGKLWLREDDIFGIIEED